MKTLRQSQRRRRDDAKAASGIPAACECCGGPPNGGKGGLCLDHDHVTSAFRGWICHRCNLGIGLLGDSLQAVERAAKYLQRASAVRRPEPSKRVAGMLAKLKQYRDNSDLL
jgi:hypothetical protein